MGDREKGQREGETVSDKENTGETERETVRD